MPVVRGPFDPYIHPMPRKPIELPPAVARRFVEDMRAFHAEKNSIKRDEIAARQRHEGLAFEYPVIS